MLKLQDFPPLYLTCTELVIVLRANTVAQSFIVDWLSNAPWVSTRSTATYWKEMQYMLPSSALHFSAYKNHNCLFDNCLPCCHQACQPQRLRSRSEFLSSPSHSLLSSWTLSGAHHLLQSKTHSAAETKRVKRGRTYDQKKNESIGRWSD